MTRRLLLLAFIFPITVWGQSTIFEENFNYPAGDNLTSHGWTAHSGAGSNPVRVISPGLIYSGYPPSGVANAVEVVGGSGSREDVNREFPVQSSGSVYSAFMVNVSDATETGSYFFHLGPTNMGTSIFRGKIFAKRNTANNVAFGIAKANNTDAVYTPFSFSLNTTYLIVMKYTFNSGTTTDDVVSLWVNADLGSPEPPPDLTQTDSGSDADNLVVVALRQAADGPIVTLDGIRIGKSWESLSEAIGSLPPVISNVTQTPQIPDSTDTVTISADVRDDGTVTSVQLFYSIDSAPFDSTDMPLVSGDTYAAMMGPQPNGTVVEYYVKAEDDEGLTSTTQTFLYTVGGPTITPIADIQANPSAYTTVTIQGIVTLGAGRTTTQWTSAYVQDTSGRGINIFQPNVVDPSLVRGNEVRITGTVDEFDGITEIVDYTIEVILTGNPIPDPLSLTTSQAANDIDLEGTYITITGTITDRFAAGNGTNVVVDDGSGAVTVRVWDDTGIDLSNLSIGDPVTVRAVMGLFQGSGQLVPGYQDEIEKVTGPPGAPTITNISQSPTSPTPEDDVTVTAEVTDDGLLVDVRLIYTINSTDTDSTDMNFIGADTYEGVIPAQAEGTTIDYHIKAIDDDGLVTTSSAFSYTVVTTTPDGLHLLITEIAVAPTPGEFIEIYNATDDIIDLVNYYITDATFAPGNQFYYNIVTGSNAGGGDFQDFHARFPTGATIQPGEFQTIAMHGSDFVATYSVEPTYELWDTDPNIPDMLEALPGSINNQGGLTNDGEVVILYHWDGQSDLVQDVDYVVWGDKAEAVDKTGVSIDGPDPGSEPSTYLDDTPIAQQIPVSTGDPHGFGESIQRVTFNEHGETQIGGNGITGHDETSEDLATSFQVGTPNPGSGPGPVGSPEITNVSQSPTSPTPEDDVTVTAEVTDDGLLVDIRLIYTINSLDTDSTDMNFIGADTYEGVIPAQAEGTTVDYHIKAIDDDGLGTTSNTFTYTVVTTTPGGLHLLITEIAVMPTPGEFIEIHNPTENTVNLTNYYLTDATFAPGGTYYYNIVTSSNAGGGDFGDFHARFPAGALIEPGEYQTIAFSGSDFIATYGVNPTYELFSTDGNIPDMLEALPASINNQGSLTNDGEVVILYYWDGQSDLVQDVDYVVWGDKAEAVDKTGVSIDGPDPGTTPSTYFNDTPISQQIPVSAGQPHSVGESIQRFILTESGEQLFGGNGITGHDETSENLAVSFQVGTPNPNDGPTSTGFADGTGLASMPFAYIDSDSLLDAPLSIVGVVNSPISRIQIDVPLFWQWSGLDTDVELIGNALQDASPQVRVEDGIISIIINNSEITQGDTATVVIKDIRSPSDSMKSVFWVKTAGEGGRLKFISKSPLVSVDSSDIHLIYDLQNNYRNFTESVKARGVTTIGAGLLRQFSAAGDSLTTAYIQDNSGRGINLFRFGLIDTNLQRGHYVEVEGSVTDFNLVTEIDYDSLRVLEKNFPLPEPVVLSNQEVNSFKWDGTLIRTHGVVIDKFSAGGGTSIVISDGGGSTTIRVWDTANLDLSDIEVNKAIFARGVGGVFVASSGDTVFQILSVYQDQLEIDPNYQPSLEDVFVRVDPYPFVPDRGENIGITYNAGAVNNQVTIRIFDLGGRLIHTLLSEQATIIQRSVEWNGRNQLRDLVPLGTYICHLEVVEQNTGEKKTAMAPIVVGTILKR